MESIMEIDDLKHAWQSLDQRLDQQHTLQLHVLRERKLDSLRRHLRPLVWGHVLQMLFGVLLVLLSVSVWSQHLHQTHLLVAGLVMHLYGIAVIIFGGVMLGRISRIDYSTPVLGLQKQLASVRRQYVIGGMCVGLPWWLLWVPCARRSVDQSRRRRARPARHLGFPPLVTPSEPPAVGQAARRQPDWRQPAQGASCAR